MQNAIVVADDLGSQLSQWMFSPAFWQFLVALLFAILFPITSAAIINYLERKVLAWLVVNPERSSGDTFRELQRRSPGRYQPLQIRTLQRGMRKIRAYLLETVEEQWQEEVIRGPVSSLVSARCPASV